MIAATSGGRLIVTTQSFRRRPNAVHRPLPNYAITTNFNVYGNWSIFMTFTLNDGSSHTYASFNTDEPTVDAYRAQFLATSATPTSPYYGGDYYNFFIRPNCYDKS